MLAIYLFLKRLRYRQTQQAVITFKIYNSGLDRLCATHFLTLLWVLIHTLGTTGLDQLTNRGRKLWRQVGLFLTYCRSVLIIDCGFVFANILPLSHFV